MMKYLLIAFIYLVQINLVFARPNGFIHPANFKGTDREQREVLNYIKKQTKEEYEDLDMDDPSTLRMMEKENLKGFKSLVSNAKNIKLLNKVIEMYCDDMDMCNYGTLWMMYKEQEKASNKELSW